MFTMKTLALKLKVSTFIYHLLHEQFEVAY